MMLHTPFHRSALFVAISSLSALSSTVVFAEDEVQQLPVIQVTATKDTSSEQTKSYIVEDSNSAMKLNISAKETPQTINVVTRQQIEDFGLNSTRAVLQNTPGVTVTAQETDRTTYMARGFEISNTLIDGLGFPKSGYNYNNTNPDTYFYDRVEVVKGADALTNSFGDPSATINYIRKRPTAEFQANGGISYGSWDTVRYEADASGAISDRVRARVMGYEQTGDSYLDRYSSEKNGFAGIIEADLTDSTLLTVGYSEMQTKPNANNWGALPLLSATGDQLSYDQDYNPNPDWAFWDNNIQNAFIELKQDIGENWTAKLTYDYTKTEYQSKLLYYYGYPTADGAGVSLTAWGGEQNQEDHFADLNLQGKYNLFNRQHEATIGYNYAKSNQFDIEQSGTILDSNVVGGLTINWASWTPTNISWSDFTEASNYDQTIHSFYAATRLHLTDDLRLILGGNYVDASSDGSSYGSSVAYDEQEFSPYTGITYNFTPEYTGYMSYTSIFRPQTGVDTNGDALKPIDGESYEIGVKSAWLDNRLTGTLGVFRTEQSNYPLRSSDGNPLSRRVDVSDLRSQGVEVGLAGKLTDNLDISFGYTQFSLTDLVNGGHARTYNPSQTINLLATYQFPMLPQLKVGAGVRWQDKIYLYDSSVDATIRQDAYALLDLMASYEVNKHLTIQANGKNLTDEKYLNSFPDGQAFYGEPANYTVALKFKY